MNDQQGRILCFSQMLTHPIVDNKFNSDSFSKTGQAHSYNLK
jgi:hypothetical protein